MKHFVVYLYLSQEALFEKSQHGAMKEYIILASGRYNN